MSHSSSQTPAGAHHGVGHIVPVWLLAAVFVVLLVLTVITVAAIKVDLGFLNIWIAMGIATVKAALVLMYFMHLRYERPFNILIFLGSLLFVFLFISMTLMDKQAYQSTIEAARAADPEEWGRKIK